MRTATSALVVCIALSAPGPSADEPSADFHVDSSRPGDYEGTREDIESNLTDELAVKLRQFDEWAVEREQEAAAEAREGGPPGGDGGDANAAADGTAMAETDGRADAASASLSTGNVPVRTRATRPTTAERRFPATSPRRPPPRADKAPQEDDVARMLREAAEQEDNPIRKRELNQQYEAYVRSL